jgi:hypothetical protein
MTDFLETKKSNKWLIVLNVIVQLSILAGMFIAIGKLQAQAETVKSLDDFRLQTTATLAVACRNIEYLTKNVDYLMAQDRARQTGSVATTQPPKYDEIQLSKK